MSFLPSDTGGVGKDVCLSSDLFCDGILGIFYRAPFVRHDTGGGTRGDYAVFVPVSVGVCLFRDSDVISESGTGNAVFDIRVYLGAVDVHIRDIVA